MGNYCESTPRTPIRDALEPLSSAPLNPNIPRSRHSGAPPFVIPAKAGIHALTSRERTPTAIPPPTSTQRRRHSAHPRQPPLQAQFARRPKRARAEHTQAPLFVFPAIESPVPRYGAGIQCGRAAPVTPKRLQATGTHFHTLVHRRQPPLAITTISCPDSAPG